MDWLISTLFFSVTFNFMNCNITEISKDGKEKNRQMRTSFKNAEPCNAYKANLAQLWSNYYNCLSIKTKNANSGQSPNMIVRAYVGSVVTLSCHLCVSPIERTQVVWMYAESYKNLSFHEIDEKDGAVINEELTLYYTRLEDQGVYRCKLGNRYGGLLMLEVTDEEKYTVVKPLSSQGPYPVPREALNNGLVTFTHWSPWSECSRCDKVGRRRRYGICNVALIDYERSNKTENPNCTSNELIKDELLKLLHDIPCRSQILPAPIRNLPEVQSRRNEIMIGLCKVPCETGIFEIRSDSGEMVERANNTAGVFSLCQPKPRQPPQIARETMFVLPGDRTFIRCPGMLLGLPRFCSASGMFANERVDDFYAIMRKKSSSQLTSTNRILNMFARKLDSPILEHVIHRTILRDVPATWRVGNSPVTSRLLDASTEGRVHLNARDHVVYQQVECSDANVYSCWQHNILAGVVKLEISTSAKDTYKNRFILISHLILVVLLLRFTRRVLRRITA